MSVWTTTSRFGRRRPWRMANCLLLESLETRCLPSVTGWPGLLQPLVETEANNTLDQAHDLGNLSLLGQGEAVGTIGTEDTDADVDWYSFTLDRPAQLTATTLNEQGGSTLQSVLGLYTTDPLFQGLLTQDDGAARTGDARVERPLAAGTYYLAVSGSGNRAFHPYLADSGLEGSLGDYGLLITATDLGIDPADIPSVLISEPANAAVLNASPFVLRVGFSAPLDPNSVLADQSVQLFFHPDGTFGDGNELPVMLAAANLNTAGDEIQVLPMAPFGPGYYRLFVAGDSGNAMFVTDLAGNPLGQDVTLDFQIDGREGRAATDPADDTAATARELGDLTGGAVVQVGGAIGDDPAYDPASSDPLLINPAADVDLYHFRIDQPGRHAFIAEAFAGRIGSPLDPGLTLFRVDPDDIDPSDGNLLLVASNDSTLNKSTSTNGLIPLYTDAALFSGLTEGDYYLAVSGSGNVPSIAAGLLPGTGGIFDPNVSHSGENGSTPTGSYVLNVRLQLDEAPPAVVTATPLDGTELGAPPTHLRVQFNEPVNLPWLYQNYQQPTQSDQAAIYLRGADGNDYYPRLVSYDNATNQAEFLLLDALPNGEHALHLSGPQGLTDLAGNPLPGNDPSGDYVIRFTVNSPTRGTTGNPLLWADQEPNDTPGQPQVLGVLFPRELQDGVRIERNFTADPASAPADTGDYYQFSILQQRSYFFFGRPAGTQLTLRNSAGNLVSLTSQQGGAVFLGNLQPGTYVLGISGWTTAQAATVSYQLRITMGGSMENPTPLTVGPAPAYRIRLVTTAPPPPPPTGDTNPPPPPAGDTNPPPPPTGETNPTPPGDTTPPSSGTPGDPVAPPTVPPPGESPLPILSPAVHVPPPASSPPQAPPAETPPAPPQTSTPPGDPAPVVSEVPQLTAVVTPQPILPPPPLRLVLSQPASNPRVAPTSTATLVGGEVTANVGVPSDILTVLRGAPVGGVRGPEQPGMPATERLAFQPPQSSPLDGMLRIVLLTQPPPEHQGGDWSDLPTAQVPQPESPSWQGPATNLPVAVQQYLQRLNQLWKATIDDLFGNGMPLWQPEAGAPPKAEPPAQPEGGAMPPQTDPPESDSMEGGAPPHSSASLAPGWAWLGMGLGLVLPTFTDPRKRPDDPEGTAGDQERRDKAA